MNINDLLDLIRRPGELTGLFAIGPDGQRRNAFLERVGPIDQTSNAWFTLNPGTDAGKGRVTTETITRVAAIGADLDIEALGATGKTLATVDAARQVVAALSEMLGTQPVAIIASGHGYQPIWSIEDGDDVAILQVLARRWGALVQSVAHSIGGELDSTYDLARLYRLPGSVNLKGDPVPVTVQPLGGRPLLVEELTAALDQWSPIQESNVLNQAPTTPASNAYWQRAVDGEVARLEAMKAAAVGPGETYRGEPWNITTNAVAFQLGRIEEGGGLPPGGAISLVMEHAPRDAGFNEAVVRAMAERCRADAVGKPHTGPTTSLPSGPTSGGLLGPQEAILPAPQWRKHSWDDFGNAERTIALEGGRLRWLRDRETWIAFRNGYWQVDAAAARGMAMSMIDRLADLEGPLYDATPGSSPKANANNPDRSIQDDFEAWVHTQRFSAKSKATESALRDSGALGATTDDFDRHPLLLNVLNGVVDLASGALLAQEPAMLLSHQAPVVYDPDARAPRWEQFLVEVMPDPEMRNYLQRIAGYTITGDTSEQAVFLHHGGTKNGKSVFFDVLGALLGTYSQQVPAGVLTQTRFEQHSTGVARMQGARLLSLSETAQGARLDEQLIKRLSGGDMVAARGMRENDREFKVIGKVHIYTNHLPHINHDEATMRRLRVLLWGITIPEEKRDPNLANRIIREELAGVLAWCVRGTHQWLQHRLSPPFTAQAATDDYVSVEDEFQLWLDARTVPSSTMTATDVLYRSYRNWAEAAGLKPLNLVTFGREMNRRKIEAARTSTTRGWLLSLQEPSISGYTP